MAISRADVLTYLEKSNMIEISELIKEIEEKFGVSAAAPVAVAAVPAAGTLGRVVPEGDCTYELLVGHVHSLDDEYLEL